MKAPRLLTFLLAAAVLPACQKEELAGPEYDMDAVAFRGTATFAASGSSEEAFDLLWEADVDRIGLFTLAGGEVELANVYYAAYSSESGSVDFLSPSRNKGIKWDETSAVVRDIYAYYPYKASNNDYTSIPVSISARQTGKAGDARAVKKNISLYSSATDVASSAETVPLSFESTAAIIRLDISSNVPIPSVKELTLSADQGVSLASEGGSLDISAGTLTWNSSVAPSNVIEYTFQEPVSISSSPVTVYLAVNALSQGIVLDLDIEYGNDKALYLGELTVPEGGIKAGTVTTYPVDFEYEGAEGYENAIDLSANGTANTYIVSKAGATYRFDATVKGNGIPRTFTWTESDGTEITRSYSDLDINPVDVRLVWYNSPKTADGYSDKSPVDLSSVMYELGTIYFTTPEPFVPGNVLLAAYNESGEILWSWNIWAAENYDPETTAKTAGRYTVMDRNLGAVAGPEVMNSSDIREAAWAVGNYYQWGRKDPFPAPAEYSDDGLDGGKEMYWGLPTHTPIADYMQDYSSKSWGSADLIFGSEPADNGRQLSSVLGSSFTVDQAVEESIKYPYRWMFWSGTDSGNDNYNWTRSSLSGTANAKAWRYLWGNPIVDPEYGTDESDNVKTIYDPCPPGWKVMPREAYAFAAASTTALSHGRYNEHTGLYFPATGQRQAGFGGSQIRSLGGLSIFLETSNVSDNEQWQGNEGGVSDYNSYIGAGYNVRCVKEEVGSLSLSHAGPACVLIGDSITRTWNSYVPGFFSTHNCIAFGADGTTTNNFVSRFFSQVIANDPKVVHIMGGINDMAGNDGSIPTEEEIFENFKTMAEQAASWGIKVMIGSTPPAGRIGWHNDEWNAEHPVIPRVQNLNKMLKAYCEERGFTYVDYYSALVDKTGALKQQYRNDDVHPNPGCFETVMGPIFLDALQKTMHVEGSAGTEGNVDDFEKEPWN